MNNIDNLNNNVPLIGGVNGSQKHSENFRQNLTKKQAITAIEKCNYRTPSKEIAFYLEQIFGIWEEVPDRWPKVALYYTPKTINSVIRQMAKKYQDSSVRLETPGAYFNSVIKYKQKKKQFRDTNGIQKQPNKS